MSFVRRILGLGGVLLVISLAVFVSLAAAHGTGGAATGDQLVVSDTNLLQTTPTATATVEATDDTTDDGTDGVDAGTTITDTTDTDVDAMATPGLDQAQPGAQPQQGVQDAQQQTPGALPQTGGVVTPWTIVSVLVIGGLILAGGLGLALTRRNR